MSNPFVSSVPSSESSRFNLHPHDTWPLSNPVQHQGFLPGAQMKRRKSRISGPSRAGLCAAVWVTAGEKRPEIRFRGIAPPSGGPDGLVQKTGRTLGAEERGVKNKSGLLKPARRVRGPLMLVEERLACSEPAPVEDCLGIESHVGRSRRVLLFSALPRRQPESAPEEYKKQRIVDDDGQSKV